MCVPLRSSGVVIGTACAYNRVDGQPFGEHDIALLSALAEQVAVGLDRATILEETRRNEQRAGRQEPGADPGHQAQGRVSGQHVPRAPDPAQRDHRLLRDAADAGGRARSTEQQRDFLESIARNGRHLLGLINNILDLSKIEAGRMTVHLTRLDLRDSIRGAVTDTTQPALRQAAERDHRCRRGAAAGRGRSHPGPPGAVQPAVQRLEVHAGRRTVVARRRSALRSRSRFRRSGRATRPRLVSRDAVWVSVRDSGIGIRADDMGKLFQVFSQVDSSASRQQQGTGLGLALCKQFVEMHGGTIGAESIFGGGSTFWFILPVEGPLRHPG